MDSTDQHIDYHPSAVELQTFLIQQGFFSDEVKLPAEDSAEMTDLLSCARQYLKDKQLNSHNPLVYLEAISYCILRQPFKDLEDSQKKALEHFAEIVATTA
ncbi:MAG: hypothetical protein WC497_03195 [Patescibacteria group bacterium]